MTTCEALGELIAGAPGELGDGAEHGATRALVDWAAAVYAGAEHPAPRALAAALASEGGGPATLLGRRRRASERTAALVNATAAHAIEVDDIYRDGIYHPGAPTIAAAFALAEARGLSGAALLRAVALGYEVGCRVAAAVTPGHYRFWHTTGTVGTLGAAAAGAAALGLGAAESAHALAVATTMAAGLQQAFRSEAMAKPLHAGHAAEAGLLAALAAAEGFTGALDVLEGPAGFAAAMCGEADWSAVVAPLGARLAVEEVTVKNHTGCGHTFAPVDAMLALRAEHGLVPDEVARIVVETAATPIAVAGNLTPTTPFEAKFSIAYCAAAALATGAVRIDAFSEERLADPVLRDLVGRTALVVSPEFDALFPHQRAARVTVQTTGRGPLTHEARTRRGDPDDPLSDDELSAKFSELAAACLGGGAGVTLQGLWATARAPSVAGLLS